MKRTEIKRNILSLMLCLAALCCMDGSAAAEDVILEVGSQPSPVPSVIYPCTQERYCSGSEGYHLSSCPRVKVYADHSHGYESFEAAVNSGAERLYLAGDWRAERPLVLGETVLDLNGFSFTGDYVGSVALNGGRLYSPDGTYMAGPTDPGTKNPPKYESLDGVFKNETDGSVSIEDGSVNLGTIWRTLPEQTVIIGENAEFTVPAGSTFCVYGKGVVLGQLNTVGNIQLGYDAQWNNVSGLSIEGPAGLNISSGIAGYSVIYRNGRYILQSEDSVCAEVGGVQYASLQEAIDNAYPGQTVRVLRDIELKSGLVVSADRELSIDLNGKTVSQQQTQRSEYSMLVNYGTLSITDSLGGGRLSYADHGEGGDYVSNTVYNEGVLNVLGGIVVNNSNDKVGQMGYPYAVDNNGQLNILGGEVRSDECSAINIRCSGEELCGMSMSGGTVKGTIDLRNEKNCANRGYISISGGSLYGYSGSSNIRYLKYDSNADEYSIEISGGYFESEENFQVRRNGNIQDLYSIIQIKGGKFFTLPEPSCIDPQYELIQTADSKFVVGIKA